MRKRSEKSLASAEQAQSSAASLVRGLKILSCFTAADSSLGNQDIIERTGLTKATASRLCAALIDQGYLDYNVSFGRYSLAAKTVALGYSALTSNAVVQVASPLLKELSERTDTSVAVAAREHADMVYLGSWRPFSPVALRLNVGSRLPLLRTAMGHAYLSDLSEPEFGKLRELLPDQARGLSKAREQAMDEIHKWGFVTAYGTWYSYINTVGVAFRPTDGSPLVGITSGSISDILSESRCHDEIGPKLREVVVKIRNALNGQTT
jgi:DNA-binding IclR family transcriptional regulator